MPSTYDLLVIGGGIHGLATASLAAANGLKVILIEKSDLGTATSSASSKLIHGGLRYLEQGEITLVKQSLAARQDLLNQAPHLVHPLAFVLPFSEFSRARWQIRLGLACYDFFAKKASFAKSRFLSRIIDSHYFNALKSSIKHAGLYFDAQAEDSRLVMENALRAKALGVIIYTHANFNSVNVVDGQWQINIDVKGQIKAKAIVNTAGPWVNEVLTQLTASDIPCIRWIKGSHLVLPALYSGKHAYILQNADQRVVFCIPYHGYTLVGTTDVNIKFDDPIQITQEEIQYLFATLSQYFTTALRVEDIRYHWSGVRTCIEVPGRAAQRLSRSTLIHYSIDPAPVVSLYGGKLTTHQSTAKKLLTGLNQHFPTLNLNALDNSPFPGAKTPEGYTYESYCYQLGQRYHWLPPLLLKRYLSLYGTRVTRLLKHCQVLKDLGKELAPNVYAREIDFLLQEEWARTAEDVLWRRTKLGLVLTGKEQRAVQEYIGSSLRGA